jgi:AraC family transcriptional regulator, regulatory protein of adaptative response / methylated-DNA-[protein]-cysteine methyltransferase
MTEIGTFTSRSSSMHGITYGYGQSSLGGFLTAIDEKGVCAILLGDDRTELLRDLQGAFPDRKLDSAPCDSIVSAVASLIEQPATSRTFPMSIRGGDFEQMVYAALRQTKPGATVTPAEVAIMIGGAVGSAQYVRAYAAKDLLAVAVPFHRLQELDETSPTYRWGKNAARPFSNAKPLPDRLDLVAGWLRSVPRTDKRVPGVWRSFLFSRQSPDLPRDCASGRPPFR